MFERARLRMPSLLLLLPRELLLVILRHLSLARLRMLKAVSRGVANACRATLRDEDWQYKPINTMAIDAELQTNRQSIKFPFTVSFFGDYFPPHDRCIGTVHELKLACINQNGYLLNYASAPGVAWHWNAVDLDAYENQERDLDEYEGKKHQIIVTDMCIEVHGEGVCGSQDSLRRTLQEAVRARALEKREVRCVRDDDWAPLLGNDAENGFIPGKQRLETALCVTVPVDCGDGAWTIENTFDANDDPDKEISLSILLRNAELVTNVGKNKWWVHEKAHEGVSAAGCGQQPVSLWSMACHGDAPYALLRGAPGRV